MLQGLDDVICRPVQCERFLARIAGRGIPHAYRTFEGEGHGFRRESTLVASVEGELSLYGQVFGFAPSPSGEMVAAITAAGSGTTTPAPGVAR